MPGNKVLSILVLSTAVIISVWLLNNQKTIVPKEKATQNLISINYADSGKNTNDDWKKLLVNVNTKNEPIVDLTKKNEVDSKVLQDNTLTGQLAIDIFSRYILSAKGGQPVNTNTADQIAQSVLSSPNYTKGTGATYSESNLHIDQNNSRDNLVRYRDTMVSVLKKNLSKLDGDPSIIVNTAITQNDPSQLSKIDPFVVAAKGLLSDLLYMQTPSSVVKIHLEIVNSVSNGLENLEGMRNGINDPVKALSSVTMYAQHLTDFQQSYLDLINFFADKGI